MTPKPEPVYGILQSELYEWERENLCWSEVQDLQRRIRARGPMAQQTPADHEQPAYICDEDNLGDIHDILTAALEGNDLSTLPRRWNQELGIIHSRSLAEHDAALIAQAREDVLTRLDKEIAIRENEMNRKGGLEDNITTASGYAAAAGALNWVRVVLIDALRTPVKKQGGKD
jgi:hypothetical protein